MKKILILSFASLFLWSCGSDKPESLEDVLASDNLEQIRSLKSELDTKQQELAGQIKQLEEKIAVLDPEEKIPLVTTFTAEAKEFQHFLELQGSVSTDQNLVIFPEYNGILTHVYVKEGQRVSKGQILAKIDDGGLSQQLAQMKIQADLARTTFERQERLWKDKIGSEIQYLQAKSSYEAQAQAVAQMEQQIGKTLVRAPFAGTIDDVITDQGSVVGMGQSSLFRIVNLNDMYIETDVPERHLANVTENKLVKVEFPVLGKEVETKIRQAGNFINPANRTFKIEVPIPNKDKSIKPNLTAKLKINDYTNEEAILIPQSIISENAEGQQYVYTVVDAKGDKATAKRVIIETGKTQGDLIEVVKGLSQGDQIIEEGARSVRDNQSVRIGSLQVAAN